ncbi:hypothetical protein FCV82_01440 [Vibrio breoganii]|uniref:ATP-binding protein n=1 Tax=Vibrio breoganii TaxID=553239 RepID=UPI0010BDFCCA|nr:ATP-binding protein [Vibrio breoganii]TKF90724.1 hypothetical protein FCV82_01440 [Vibrio breoganii]
MSHFSALRGFRLQHFSTFNWGTFDGAIVTLSPEQSNSLLTGNIGSGKSTLVDGLTTLLVPTRKLSFNKAAGAEDKERSLESYFHGYYTSQQDDYGKARAVGLRQQQHYSVLLAVFTSEALKQSVTVAQVFWMKPGEKKVKRLFVVSEMPLTIAEHFTEFGSQISQLKKQLKSLSDTELFDSYPPYAQAFSKRLGLGADGKALELFNQTISMKSVGSVTDFVRQNMLEQPDVAGRLEELERNYDDLKRLHDAVVAARQKVELLTPIQQYGLAAQQAADDRAHFNQSRELVDAYMAGRAIELYQSSVEKKAKQLAGLEIVRQQQQTDKNRLEANIERLREEIRNNGGGRLEQLEQEIAQTSQMRDDSRKLCNHYLKLVDELALNRELTADTYVHNLNAAKDTLESLSAQQDALDEAQFSVKQQQDVQVQQQRKISEQVNALRSRKSNIHVRQLNLRERLCEALEVDEETLPFVGELVQVKSSQSLWQGAIERVLHNFALSLLVPPHLYQQVSEFVENNHLGTRLVYYRIQEHSPYQALSPQANSLLGKIEIKSDSHYYPWLFQELSKRFDYQCCEKMEDFRRSERAITPSGQIKASKSRHEKDDRYKIQDKSRYVLGWSNQEKLALLETQYKQLSVDIGKIEQQVQTHKRSKEALASKTYSARTLAEFDFSFEQIHWLRFSQAIDELEQEKQQLEQSSNVLSDLKHRLSKEQHSAGELGQKFQHTLIEIGKCEESLEADNTKLKDKKQHLESVPTALRERYFPVLDDFYQTYLTHSVLRINMLENVTSELRRKLNEKIQHLEDKRRKKQAQMTTAMGDFANQFPNDVLELDRSIEALPEYQQKLTALIEEDLPRHEANFKQMLNRDTIRAMALFSSYLDRQQEQIDARIRLINQALHDLDYQVGTYIEIDSIASHDIEVRDFKQRLKHCIEFSTDDSLYSEEKFERVKDLIEQMRNDPKWTKKVVDVRYWQLFNVVERYREDHSEKECYSDSGGKSGGQKEKLAYSILAAAILLQYGLVAEEQDNSKRVKRRFNLVVIDEAFARGSKDSTRFGLELFKRLGLQLLLVTPLQKLDVIEHYVQHVHFVDQRNNRSMLLNMTIEEYRDRLTQHAQLQRYRNVVKEQGAE